MTVYASELKKEIEDALAQEENDTFNAIIEAVDEKISKSAAKKSFNAIITSDKITKIKKLISKEVVRQVKEHYISYGYEITVYGEKEHHELGGKITIEISWR